MSSPAIAKHKKSAVKPHQKMHLEGSPQPVNSVIGLPDTRQIITCSIESSSLRVWDLESGMRVGEWKDEGSSEGVFCMALSPNGKTVACGCLDGIVKLWGINSRKIVKKLTRNIAASDSDLLMVTSVCWSPDGGRLGSGFLDGTFRVWNVQSRKTILGPINVGQMITSSCYSTDGEMISIQRSGFAPPELTRTVRDANTGKLLKTLTGGARVGGMAWTSDGNTLMIGTRRFDTATWTEINHEWLAGSSMDSYTVLSPNERILASMPTADKSTIQLWNIQTHQPIGPPLHHEDEDEVSSAVFAADGNFLVTGCDSGHIYAWDISAILIKAGLNDLQTVVKAVNKPFIDVNATQRQAPKTGGVRRVPQGFFDDVPPRVNSSTSPRESTEPGRSPSHNPLSLVRNFISGMLRRRDRSAIRLLPVEVPLTAGKPRNYHARKKPSASSSRPPKPPTTQQQNGGATQNILPSSQQPPATASTTPPAVTGTLTAAGTSHPDITIKRAGWRARFLLWVCCVPIQNTGG